jgi:hypothetical protein
MGGFLGLEVTPIDGAAAVAAGRRLAHKLSMNQ